MGVITENQLPLDIQAEAYSVIDHPRPLEGRRLWSRESYRGPLLPAKGTRERERALHLYAMHDYNTLFRGAVAGLIKRVQSTPYEIVSSADASRWQDLLMSADFGDWDRFVSKLVQSYCNYDGGAWIELIAPGDPMLAPAGAVVGLAILDPLRCYPTGNPAYPVIYYDLYNRMHIMPAGRVVQFVDNPATEEHLAGYGDCALSRCIAPVNREILMGRYVEQLLDDKPPPGVNLWTAINPDELNAAWERMEREAQTDNGGRWGRAINLFSLDTGSEAKMNSVTFANPPDNFDYVQYTELNVSQIALGIGLDKQDLWELTGGGIGTGTQSEILAQKSRGKAFGRILKGLERLINRALPDAVEFRWQYSDPQEDKESAEKASLWASTVQIVNADTTSDERRRLLANQSDAWRDVLTNSVGQVVRLPDDDPKAIGQGLVNLTPAPATSDQPEVAEDTDGGTGGMFGQKSLETTAADFLRRFVNFVKVGNAQDFSEPIMRASFRAELQKSAVKAYNDGLSDGGLDPDDTDTDQRNRRIADWLAVQNEYIEKFVKSVSEEGVTPETAKSRGDLWVNKSLRSIYYAGLNDAAGNKFFTWRLGATKDHCKTCLSNNGQVHRLKDWMKSGCLPGSICTECKGFNCLCELERSNGPERGRLPGQSGGGVLDKFARFLRGLVGKSIQLEGVSA